MELSCISGTLGLIKPVLQGLTRKYDIHFNFFLTKPANQIIYNHPCPNTIAFKDSAIFADHHEYLKRYYFLVNQLDKPQITDRIQLLADFYANAILLRHEHPLMILTRTKSIFLKRLKRMKKMLVEEGSSEESKTPGDQKAVSINSSRFLRTLSSDQLDMKSLDEFDHLHLDLSLLGIDQQMQVHDVFESPPESEPPSPLDRFSGFRKEMSCELILDTETNEKEISHLTMDFQDFDKEELTKQYMRMIEKQNEKKSIKSYSRSKREIGGKLKDLMEKKPMTTSITISGADEHPDRFMRPENKQSMIAPRVAQVLRSQGTKRSSFFSYELQAQRKRAQQLNQYVIRQMDREESPRKHLKFNLGQMTDRYRNYSNKEIIGSPKYQTRGQPFKTRSKIFSQDQQEYQQFPSKEYPVHAFDYGYPTNRTTSINININGLEENREGVNLRMPKYGGEEAKEQERMLRAEKKKKIREKAAALLNRVKSQDYMRTIHEHEDQEYQGYYQ